MVLFNNGVGYFGRTGEVEGEARVDLSFAEWDINDLFKSVTIQDFNNEHISAVCDDSREPVSRTLSSYAINQNGEPTLANILGQVRGEQVGVVMNTTVTTPPGTIKGTILGHEMPKVSVGNAQVDCVVLNVSTTEGFRRVKMMDTQRVLFLSRVRGRTEAGDGHTPLGVCRPQRLDLMPRSRTGPPRSPTSTARRT